MEQRTIQELNRIKNRIGLVSGSLHINEYDDAQENISAHINPHNWNIEINLNRDFEPIKNRIQKAYARKKEIGNGKKQLLEDVLYHELAHWEMPFGSENGCPYDTYNHDLILEAIKQALPEDKQVHASYVANAFEDLLINARCKEYTGNFSGFVLFYDEQGEKVKELKGKQEKYTPFYDAFVKLNMFLWGDESDKKLLRRHFSNSKEVEDAVGKVIQELNLEQRVERDNKGKVIDTKGLFDRQEWPGMARRFASAVEPLLEQMPLEALSPFSAPYTGGGGEQEQEGEDEQEQARNGIEQKMKSKQGKEEIAYGRYTNNEPLSPNITDYEQLDSLYRRLARAIPVNVEAITKEQSLPITPLNFREFDDEKDDIRKIKPTKLFANEKGITFGYPKENITVIERSKVQRRSFPDFKMVVLDNSGSMADGVDGSEGNTTFIPWGDNSKYHYALLGFYGIENFLQMQGIAQYIGHGLSLFSSSTRYDEADFRGIQKLRKLALSPEFGSTRLDAHTLVDALKGRESFVLSISDGEIGNWHEAKPEFEKLARDNYFAHIQIGYENQFTRDLEQAGFPVFYVNSGDELSRLMVNVATNTYRRFVRE